MITSYLTYETHHILGVLFSAFSTKILLVDMDNISHLMRKGSHHVLLCSFFHFKHANHLLIPMRNMEIFTFVSGLTS
jgi:hypothetical protein